MCSSRRGIFRQGPERGSFAPCADGFRPEARFWLLGPIGADGMPVIDVVAVAVDTAAAVDVRRVIIVVARRPKPPIRFSRVPV
jgi:hypothetical protein